MSHLTRLFTVALGGFCAAVCAVVFASAALAGEIVLSDDGRQVQLNADGSWVYVQKNRYATAADGRRFLLAPDGSWREVQPESAASGAAGVSTAPAATAMPAAPLADTGLRLAAVEIQRKKTKGLKSTRIQTRTLFQVEILNHSSGTMQLHSEQAGQIRASSSNGEKFELREASFSSAAVEPGQRSQLLLVYNGSPKWFGVRYLRLEIPAGVFGSEVPVYLDRDMDEVSIRSVDAFAATPASSR